MNRKELKVVMLGKLPFDLLRSTGGVESVCLNLLHGFKEQPVSVDWISFTGDVSSYTARRPAENITLHYIPIRYRSSLVDFFFNRRELNRILSDVRPDIVHIQGAAPHLLRLTGLSREKIVVTQHGIMALERQLVSGFLRRLKFSFKYLIEKHYFPGFKNFVFISEYGRSLFPAKKIRRAALICNPVNPLFLGPVTATPLETDIVCIGWISKLKNQLLLLQSLVDLRVAGYKPTLAIIGAVKEQEYQNEIQRFVAENDLGDQVRFLGALPQDRVAEELQKSRILVVPSLQEHLPVCIAEAMALGKVVVASNVGAVAEMVSDGKTGLLFDRGDRNRLTQLLSGLFDGSIAGTPLREAARTFAHTHYAPTTVVAHTIDFYRTIMDHND